jgi:predicted nucleic acid-binding protein
MAASPRRIYWDACVWIALIQREKILFPLEVAEDRDTMCRSVIEAAKKGTIEILTSTLSLAEVCKNPGIRSTRADLIADYFETDYILLANVDRGVGERARVLMTSGHSGLKPPDAIHLATAALSGVEEMHTFDGRLLDLNGVIDKSDGTKLRIRKPDPGGPPAPLLDAMKEGSAGEEASAP